MAYINTFHMKPLPKPEYKAMQTLIKKYELIGPQELFAVGIAVLAELSPADIRQRIAALRSSRETDREYLIED